MVQFVVQIVCPAVSGPFFKYLPFSVLMCEIEFVRYSAFITYLCIMCSVTTFKTLYKEFWLIYWISEFLYTPVWLSTSAPTIPYQWSPSLKEWTELMTKMAKYKHVAHKVMECGTSFWL